MKYRKDKHGNLISVLGYGCMRFPQTLGKINKDKTEQQIMTAIDAGVNYFDTAYMYPGSESVLGEILEKLFNEQLRRLRTDHVDYYLMHMLSDIHDKHYHAKRLYRGFKLHRMR